MRIISIFLIACLLAPVFPGQASAQLLLANHHILFADLSLREGGNEGAAIMPRYEAVILDEAHNVEDVAVSYFDTSLSRSGLMAHLGRLVNRRNPERGLAPFLSKRIGNMKGPGRKVREDVLDTVRKLTDEVTRVRGSLDSLFEDVAEDLAAWLESVAQADLGDNAFVMRDTRSIVNRLETARRVWEASDVDTAVDNVEDLVNASFVLRAADQPSLQPNGKPVNDSFSISSQLDVSGVSTEDAQTLVVLPCRSFQFLPESTELTLESRRILDRCVIPTLSQSVGLFLQVQGSSAWPANDPPYTEEDILEVAEGRAQSVVDYLVSQGIDPARFIVEATLPPEDHHNSDDPQIQAQDRFVELTLITVGR